MIAIGEVPESPFLNFYVARPGSNQQSFQYLFSVKRAPVNMGTATVDASGNAPKEANGIPTLKLNDGNEIPLVISDLVFPSSFDSLTLMK